MKSSIVRFVAVAFIAAGSFTAVSASPAAPSSAAAVAPQRPGGPLPMPFPVCPSCGRNGNKW